MDKVKENNISNKSNANRICSDFCRSMLKLVSRLTSTKSTTSARPTTQALCQRSAPLQHAKYSRTQDAKHCKMSPKDGVFPHVLINVHSDTFPILFKCLFVFSFSLLSTFLFFQHLGSFHCPSSRSGKKRSRADIFGHNADYFLGVFRGCCGVLRAFQDVYRGGQP